jgi:hypothetical protein
MEGDRFEDLGVDGGIIFKRIFTITGMGRHGLECSGSKQRKMAGNCKRRNDLLGTIKYGEFLD